MTQTIKQVISPLLKDDFNVGETLQVLSYNKGIYWSWGVHDLSNICNKGLMFRVNGHHHKGWVLITLDWTDTYDVYLISTHGNIVKDFHQVYFDMLVELIDNHIEKIPEYEF